MPIESPPIQPKYGPPYQPPAGEGGSDPDRGKDLRAGVSELAIHEEWAAGGPSFNNDPSSSSNEEAEPETTPTPAVRPLRVSMVSVRSGMSSMVGELQALVDSYQALRTRVFDTRETVFGQFATTTVEIGTSGGSTKEFTAPSQEQMFRTSTRRSVIADAAVEFAASMNPAQDRVLGQIADSIQIAGQFLAAIDRAGQSYAQADRKARFPEPPQGSLTRT